MKKKNISEIEENLTILVHGPIMQMGVTKKCLKQVRLLFPKACIILSTWKGSNCEGLEYDKLVLNDDPGANYFNVPLSATDSKENPGCKEYTVDGKTIITKPKLNNVNRMLTTIKKGLNVVDSEYCFKLRSDIILHNKNFLTYWNKYDKYNTQYKIFKHRIINDSTYAQFAHVMQDGIQLLPFHMSDWMHFGYTEDLNLLFSCPFQDDESAYSYWNYHERKQYEPFLDAMWQYPTETYILYSLVKNYFPDCKFENSDDYNEENMTLSNKIIANNFIMVDDDKFTFKLGKYPSVFDWDDEIYDGFITNLQWQHLYKTYCDKNYKFIDIDIKRIARRLFLAFDLIFLLKFPRKFFNRLRTLKLDKRYLRKKFFVLNK